jgi:tetratricopeptide (TPR) repeat protein
LSGLAHFWQTWNNCGPATLAMNLSYYGSTLDQAAIGSVLRSHQDDKNVMPEELAAFAQSQGYQAQVRVNGDAGLLRTLLNNGIPILIETWLEEEPNNGMGHYRLLVGYDDEGQRWIAYDSYVRGPQVNPNGAYAGIYLPYAQTAAWWKVFNYTYVLIYSEEQRALIESILGDEHDPGVMWQRALETAQAAVNSQPDDPFLWFNLGTDLVHFGDYAGAATAYDRARQLGLPWRMWWYQFGPLQAYYAVGRQEDVRVLAEATLAITPSIEEIHYWRGMALAAQGQVDAAQRSWRQALALNPNFTPAREALGQSE